MGASSIKPLDPELDSLLREWVEKAEADLEAAETGSQCGGQHPPPRNCRLPLPADRRKLPEGSRFGRKSAEPSGSFRRAASIRLREIVGFHCQQTVENYLKVLLTFYQIEFPKTHEIGRVVYGKSVDLGG